MLGAGGDVCRLNFAVEAAGNDRARALRERYQRNKEGGRVLLNDWISRTRRRRLWLRSFRADKRKRIKKILHPP